MIQRVSELEVLMLNLRNATVLLSVFVALACRALDQSDHSADVKAIRAVLDAHGEAWTRGEAVAAVATLTDDADWVGGDGQTLEGKAAILAMHEKMLAGPAKGTRHSHPGTPNIRFIRSDVAIVDGNSENVGISGREWQTTASRIFTLHCGFREARRQVAGDCVPVVAAS